MRQEDAGGGCFVEARLSDGGVPSGSAGASDNGREFSGHMHVAAELDCDDHFARPCRSCDRGTNENGNGLLWQCFPKAMPLHEVTPERVQDAVDRLDDRTRKCLGYQTPREAFWDAMIS